MQNQESNVTVSTFCRADKLRLAALFQSTEETRYYLNGVFIHATDKGICLVATDGHRLAVFRDEAGFTSANCIAQLPKEAFAAIKKSKNKQFLWFGIIGSHAGIGRREARVFDTVLGQCDGAEEAQDAMLDVAHPGVIWAGAVDMIDGTFPDYQKVIPTERAQAGVSAPFNPKLLAAFTEVSRDVQSNHPVMLFPAGESQAIMVDCGRSDFVGVLMAMRSDPTFEKVIDKIHAPAWALRGAMTPHAEAA